MKISCASNLDNTFIQKVISSQIDLDKNTEFFLSFPQDTFSVNRHYLPDISEAGFDEHIGLISENGFKINYLLNSLNIKDYEALEKRVKQLLQKGVTRFTVSDLEVVSFLSKKFPKVEIVLSIIYWLKDIGNLEEILKKYTIKRVIFEQSLNHNFKELQRLIAYCKERLVETELLVNEVCFSDCKFRKQHYEFDSCYTRSPETKTKFGDYCNVRRGSAKIVLDSPWIRPEDIEIYETLGLDYLKLSGRNTSTNILFTCLEAYLRGRYEGNFFNLMDLDGKRDGGTGREEPRYLDNRKLDTFLKNKRLKSFLSS